MNGGSKRFAGRTGRIAGIAAIAVFAWALSWLLSPPALVIAGESPAADGPTEPLSAETAAAPVGPETVIIVKAESTALLAPSGDGQYADVGNELERPLTVRIIRAGDRPVAGHKVIFSTISTPARADGVVIQPEVVVSDAEGLARARVTLGSKAGDYVISARIHNGPSGQDEVFFKVNARTANWAVMLVIGLFGGLAFFLYGIGLLSEGMKKAAGSQMRAIMGGLTSNRFMAVFVGALVTVIFQSSSATTVMLVGFVQAGLMSFTQSLGVILGADIGTTMTVQLIAFKITDYVLVAIAIGFLMTIASKKELTRNIGRALMGFGILFFGMHIMSDAMRPLRTYTPFLTIIAGLESPALAILVATAFTALIQSSAAFIAIAILLASQGVIDLETGIALSLGANIGTCITAALASINTSREAKRVALAHTLFKVIGALLLVTWIPWFAEGVAWMSSAGASVERQIANAHTIFNVGITFLFLPFIQQMATLVERIFPDRALADGEMPVTLALDPHLLTTPAMALSVAKVEVLRLGEKVQNMVEKGLGPMTDGGAHDIEAVTETIDRQEREVDEAYLQITSYLRQISAQDLTSDRVQEIFQMMHTLTDLEQIADLVHQSLLPLVAKLEESADASSEAANLEVCEYHTKTLKQISRALAVFDSVNLDEARYVAAKYQKYRLLAADLQRTHFARLHGDDTRRVTTSEAHLDLIDALKRIASHATNIARYLYETGDASLVPEGAR